MFEDDEKWFESAQAAKEDFVSNMIGNMTAEEIDSLEFTPEMIDRARHFRRIDKLGYRANKDNVQAEFIKAVSEGEEDETVSALESEVEYYGKYDDSTRPKNAKEELEDSSEYDGRDDDMIKAIAEQIGEEWENENEPELPDSDPIDFSVYAKLI